MKPSQLKLNPTEFNGCPGGDAFASYVVQNKIDLKYVDLDQYEFWSNKVDTVVFTLTAADPLDFGNFIDNIKPDEYLIRTVDGQKVVRLWWD